MAGLLLSVFLVASLPGCLIPQDDQVIPELPPKRNSPLSIVDFKPALRGTFRASAACFSQNETFAVTVADADRGDIVRSLWYVDIDRVNPVPVGIEPRPVSLVTGIPLIPAPTSSAFTSQLSGLMTGVHTVTVYVTDSTFDVTNDAVTAYRQPVALDDGGTVNDPAYIDSFTWILDVESCQ